MSYFQNIISKNQKRLKILRDGQLDSSSPKYIGELSGLKLPLKQHQLTLINACLNLEKSCSNLVDTDILRYQSNLGIIADNVGGGKSISVLALILAKPSIKTISLPVQFINYENNYCFYKNYLKTIFK